jgi:hypothetical protein
MPTSMHIPIFQNPMHHFFLHYAQQVPTMSGIMGKSLKIKASIDF